MQKRSFETRGCGDEGFDNDPRGNGRAARKVSWRHIFIKCFQSSWSRRDGEKNKDALIMKLVLIVKTCKCVMI